MKKLLFMLIFLFPLLSYSQIETNMRRGSDGIYRSNIDDLVEAINETRRFPSSTIILNPGTYLLKRNISIPNGVTLVFRDGAIFRGNYTITGIDTRIVAGYQYIFDTIVDFAGTFEAPMIYPYWFGSDTGAAYISKMESFPLITGAVPFITQDLYPVSDSTIDLGNDSTNVANVYTHLLRLKETSVLPDTLLTEGTILIKQDSLFMYVNSSWKYTVMTARP